jgi:hypothetical protein
VLHCKPEHSVVSGDPDHHVVTTNRGVVYPFEGGAWPIAGVPWCTQRARHAGAGKGWPK